MDIKDFKNRLNYVVDDFYFNWLKESNENPELYPLNLGDEDEWWEMFLAHTLCNTYEEESRYKGDGIE